MRHDCQLAMAPNKSLIHITSPEKDREAREQQFDILLMFTLGWAYCSIDPANGQIGDSNAKQKSELATYLQGYSEEHQFCILVKTSRLYILCRPDSSVDFSVC